MWLSPAAAAAAAAAAPARAGGVGECVRVLTPGGGAPVDGLVVCRGHLIATSALCSDVMGVSAGGGWGGGWGCWLWSGMWMVFQA